MRIYHIGTRGIPTTQGGIERHIEEIATRLAGRAEITVYARRYYVPPMGDYKGVRIRRLPTVRTKHLDTILYALLATLDVLFRRRGIVHYHALGPSVFAWLPRLAGHRTVVTVHGLDWQRAKWGRLATAYLRACESFSARFPNRTIVVSQVLREYYRRKFGAEVAAIPNGIQAPTVREPREIAERWGLEGRGYVFFIARLTPEKGAHHLIRAFRGLETDKKLVIAGEGLHEDRYVAGLRELAASDPRVVFTGFVSGSLLDELYSNAYVYCQPSEIEGLSIALLEAMSYGCCVLSSDIPENLELVAEVGHRFASKDVDDLRAQLRRLLDSPATVAASGRAAREHALARYSWDRVAEQTYALYAELAGSR
ncbi:MAG: glycosyltransferase family 4 protein [Candidatus Krumholzibacteriota bacterium]|nr:glycosyltransferase family 4 protein [Candidatus Krumholzibacteriota bacterium]